MFFLFIAVTATTALDIFRLFNAWLVSPNEGKERTLITSFGTQISKIHFKYKIVEKMVYTPFVFSKCQLFGKQRNRPETAKTDR